MSAVRRKLDKVQSMCNQSQWNPRTGSEKISFSNLALVRDCDVAHTLHPWYAAVSLILSTRAVCVRRAEHNRIAGYRSRGSYLVHAAIKTITVTSRNNWVAAHTRTIWRISALIASRYHGGERGRGRLLSQIGINLRGRITICTHACWAIVIFFLSSPIQQSWRIEYEKFLQRS